MSKVTLYLMTLKGYKVLNSLINTNNIHLISSVIYGEDNNVKNDYSKEIKLKCKEYNINCYNRKDPVNKLKSAFSIAISWRWLINIDPLSTLIVLHDSLLPKYRGFSPLVSSLVNGESRIGVTALIASEEYDKGSIISQESISVTYPLKIEKAIEEIIPCYNNLVVKLFEKIKNNEKFQLHEQDESKATYSLWRDENDYKIDWNHDAKYIKRFVDAVGFPYAGAYTTLENNKIRVSDVKVLDDVTIENRTPGKLIYYKNNRPVIVCGTNLIQLNEAHYDDTGKSIFPLKNFRIKLL